MAADMHPKFLSLEFHTRFFPALMRGRLRSGESEHTGFTSTAGLYILLALFPILLIAGVPGAVSRGPVTGWIMAGAGAAPPYGGFLRGIFLFSVVLGMTAGVFTGTLKRSFAPGSFFSGEAQRSEMSI